MNYSVSNTIEKPLAHVIQKFSDPEGVKHWMEGLQKIERISGEHLEPGSKSEFTFVHKNKEMMIEETVLEQNLPNQIKFGYTSSMGYNEVEILFEELTENSVRQTNKSYFELKGLMMLVGFFMKGMFKKQSMKFINGFKAFAEK